MTRRYACLPLIVGIGSCCAAVTNKTSKNTASSRETLVTIADGNASEAPLVRVYLAPSEQTLIHAWRCGPGWLSYRHVSASLRSNSYVVESGGVTHDWWALRFRRGDIYGDIYAEPSTRRKGKNCADYYVRIQRGSAPGAPEQWQITSPAQRLTPYFWTRGPLFPTDPDVESGAEVEP
jgi:hypothetical protein